MRLEQVKLYMGYEVANEGKRFGVRPGTESATSWQSHAAAMGL